MGITLVRENRTSTSYQYQITRGCFFKNKCPKDTDVGKAQERMRVAAPASFNFIEYAILIVSSLLPKDVLSFLEKRGVAMTALIGWIGVDKRHPCSAYLMSDSRISWQGTNSPYDYGRKLFALRNNPDVLGYCGDVLFPSHVLSQIYELDCNGLLFPVEVSSAEKSDIIFRQIQKQFIGYPTHARNQVSIYHFSRDIDLSFHAFCYRYSPLSGCWERRILEIDYSKSSIVICDGSGASDFRLLYAKYQNGDIAGTSRNLFQCFCDFLHQTKDTTCGGPPQLVGLYNGEKFNGMSFGIIYDGATYFCGSPCSSENTDSTVRWYNENFEICDGSSLEREAGAMRQPNPNR